MGEALLFICAIFVVIAVAIIIGASTASQKAAEEGAKKAAAAAAEKERLETFLAKEAEDWAFQDVTKVDGDPGLIALDDDGKVFRLATYKVDGEAIVIANDEKLSINSIKSIDVSQPMKAKTVVHVDKMPVAIQPKQKSSIGRAVVGGVVAGPLGAVVGGISGVGGKTEIQYHDNRRTETVMVKGDAVLVIGTGNFKRPTIRLAFANNKILNQWSARLWAARGW